MLKVYDKNMQPIGILENAFDASIKDAPSLRIYRKGNKNDSDAKIGVFFHALFKG